MTRGPLTRILHVEDEPDIQEIARMALEMVGGFTVASCDGGQDALAKASTFRPDLILLDVMMPGMDGPTTLAELRKLPDAAATPIVFMTAKVQTHEVARLKELGAADVIEKPFDPMTLADRVTAIWNEIKD